MQQAPLKVSLQYLHEELEEHSDLLKELKSSNNGLSGIAQGQTKLCRSSFETVVKLEDNFERFKNHVSTGVQGLESKVSELQKQNQDLVDRLSRLEVAHSLLVAKILVPSVSNELRTTDRKPESTSHGSTSANSGGFSIF